MSVPRWCFMKCEKTELRLRGFSDALTRTCICGSYSVEVVVRGKWYS